MTRRYSAKVDANQAAIVDGRGMWKCESCGKQERATVHRMRNRFCSRDCARPQVIASSGETWKARREVLACEIKRLYHHGISFEQVASSMGLSKSKVCVIAKEFGIKRRSAVTKEVCRQCGASFNRYRSSSKQFCSYTCHLESGGARRAGEAAVIAMKKYGAKKDGNHSLIFGIISTLVPAKDLSNAGFGVPDGIAWVGGGWQFFDIKNPKTGYGKRGLNPRQQKWADEWRGGPVFLIYTEDEAKRFCAGKFEEIKRFGGDEKWHTK